MKKLQQQPVAESKAPSSPVVKEAPDKKAPLRGVGFAEGEAMLKPGGPVQKKDNSAPKANTKAPGTTNDKAPGGAIADQMPADLDLQSVRMSFTIPGKKTFADNWQYTAQTTGPTAIGFDVSPTGLSIWASPGLYFDATWPAQNMNMYSAGVNFTTGKPYADFRVVRGMGEGFLDYTDKGEKSVTDLLAKAIAGTAMAKPGYNPMKDKDLLGTLAKVKANFDAMPTVGGGGDKVAAEEVSRPTIGATLGMKTPFVKTGAGAGMSIPGGGSFNVAINGTGNLASILAAGSKPQAAAMAAGIQNVIVTSDAMTLIKENGKPIAKLQQITVHKGGAVTLDRFELLGGLGAGAGLESLIRLLVIAGSAQQSGGHGGLAAHQALQNGAADAHIVKGVSKNMIESGLSEAIRTLLVENRNALPGLDLALVFGVK